MMTITVNEMMEHMEDENFFREYGNPVKVVDYNETGCIVMSEEVYTQLLKHMLQDRLS